MGCISTFAKIRFLNESLKSHGRDYSNSEAYTIGALTAEYYFVYGMCTMNKDFEQHDLIEKYDAKVNEIYHQKVGIGETYDRIEKLEDDEKNYRETFLFEGEEDS